MPRRPEIAGRPVCRLARARSRRGPGPPSSCGADTGHYAEILQLRRCTDIFRQAVNRGIEEGTFAAVDVHRVVRAISRWASTWSAGTGPADPTHPSSSASSTPTWPSAWSPVRNNAARREEQTVPASAIFRQDLGPV